MLNYIIAKCFLDFNIFYPFFGCMVCRYSRDVLGILGMLFYKFNQLICKITMVSKNKRKKS